VYRAFVFRVGVGGDLGNDGTGARCVECDGSGTVMC
jgi:hypothetical protein